MSFSAKAASRLLGNKNNDGNKKFDAAWRINKTARAVTPVTQAQLDMIATLRGYLDNAGVRNDFIIQPDTSLVASHVIRALIRLANKHGVDTGRGRKSFNGV